MATLVSGEGAIFFERVTLRDVDFRKAAFETFAPVGCVFDGCDFRETVFDKRLAPMFQSRPRSVFRECRFDGADLRHAPPGQSRFERCSFDDALLDGWQVLAAEFVECHFSGRMELVTFHGKPWGRDAAQLAPARAVNEFRGNDFRGADLHACAFIRGIPLNQQLWPEDERYVRLDRFHQRLARGRLEILSWRDLESRAQALDLVQAASFLYREQNDIIARRIEERSPAPADVQRRVWAVLGAVL